MKGNARGYHRPGARGVRGARKLDIILDEEEDNEQDTGAGEAGSQQKRRADQASKTSAGRLELF